MNAEGKSQRGKLTRKGLYGTGRRQVSFSRALKKKERGGWKGKKRNYGRGEE